MIKQFACIDENKNKYRGYQIQLTGRTLVKKWGRVSRLQNSWFIRNGVWTGQKRVRLTNERDAEQAFIKEEQRRINRGYEPITLNDFFATCVQLRLLD